MSRRRRSMAMARQNFAAAAGVSRGKRARRCLGVESPSLGGPGRERVFDDRKLAERLSRIEIAERDFAVVDAPRHANAATLQDVQRSVGVSLVENHVAGAVLRQLQRFGERLELRRLELGEKRHTLEESFFHSTPPRPSCVMIFPSLKAE